LKRETSPSKNRIMSWQNEFPDRGVHHGFRTIASAASSAFPADAEAASASRSTFSGGRMPGNIQVHVPECPPRARARQVGPPAHSMDRQARSKSFFLQRRSTRLFSSRDGRISHLGGNPETIMQGAGSCQSTNSHACGFKTSANARFAFR